LSVTRLTGGLLKIRVNETSQTDKSNSEGSTLERFDALRISREGGVSGCLQLLARQVSRIFPTLGSDLDSKGNARSNRSGTLDGFVSVKRLKRAKLERWL